MEFAFEDDIFSGTRVKPAAGCQIIDLDTEVLAYAPPNHKQAWFLEINVTKVSYSNCRMSGAFLYFKKDYEKALEYYLAALNLTENQLCSLETIESISRCYLKLNDFENALVFAKKMEENMKNYDHEIQVWNLFVEIYSNQKKMGDEAIFYITLILSQVPTNFRFWLKIAEIFETHEFNTFFTGKTSNLEEIRVLSIIRAYKLVKHSLKSSVGQGKTLNETLLHECNTKMSQFPQEIVSKMMQRDDKLFSAPGKNVENDNCPTDFTYRSEFMSETEAFTFINPNLLPEIVNKFWNDLLY